MAQAIFFHDIIQQVWEKAHIAFDEKGDLKLSGKQMNPDEWRKDDNGNLMCREDYGNIASPFGWQIDHIVPVELGGANYLSNLRPLWWPATQEED